MLILTTNAFPSACGAPPMRDWPGPRALAVLPGSGLDHAAIEALNDEFIILEWLESPASLTEVLSDAALWLGDRLREDETPLLCLDRQPRREDVELDPRRVSLQAVQAEYDDNDRLVRLVLGELVATSPLLPEFFRLLEGRPIGDKLVVELLADVFPREVA